MSHLIAYKASMVFMYRLRMARVKMNYQKSYGDLNFPLGCLVEDRQEHLLVCAKIREVSDNVRLNRTVNYLDIFSSSTEDIRKL